MEQIFTWLIKTQAINGLDDSTKGGAIIFVTDGKQDCNGGLDIDDQSVIDRIIKTKVRITTVAFGYVTHHFTFQIIS